MNRRRFIKAVVGTCIGSGCVAGVAIANVAAPGVAWIPGGPWTGENGKNNDIWSEDALRARDDVFEQQLALEHVDQFKRDRRLFHGTEREINTTPLTEGQIPTHG